MYLILICITEIVVSYKLAQYYRLTLGMLVYYYSLEHFYVIAYFVKNVLLVDIETLWFVERAHVQLIF